MREELFYQIINILAVNQAFKSFAIIKSLQKSLQKRKHQCWWQQVKKRRTFLNSFKRDLARVIQITLDVSEFLNIHIFNWYKALFRHPVVLFGILILSKRFDGFVKLLLWWILKDRQLYLHKYVKYWFYIRLSLWQNESRYEI